MIISPLLAIQRAAAVAAGIVKPPPPLRAVMRAWEYARATRISPAWAVAQRQAAEVFRYLNTPPGLESKTEHLAAIHAAPSWLWPALVAAMLPPKDKPKGLVGGGDPEGSEAGRLSQKVHNGRQVK